MTWRSGVCGVRSTARLRQTPSVGFKGVSLSTVYRACSPLKIIISVLGKYLAIGWGGGTAKHSQVQPPISVQPKELWTQRILEGDKLVERDIFCNECWLVEFQRDSRSGLLPETTERSTRGPQKLTFPRSKIQGCCLKRCYVEKKITCVMWQAAAEWFELRSNCSDRSMNLFLSSLVVLLPSFFSFLLGFSGGTFYFLFFLHFKYSGWFCPTLNRLKQIYSAPPLPLVPGYFKALCHLILTLSASDCLNIRDLCRTLVFFSLRFRPGIHQLYHLQRINIQNRFAAIHSGLSLWVSQRKCSGTAMESINLWKATKLRSTTQDVFMTRQPLINIAWETSEFRNRLGITGDLRRKMNAIRGKSTLRWPFNSGIDLIRPKIEENLEPQSALEESFEVFAPFLLFGWLAVLQACLDHEPLSL